MEAVKQNAKIISFILTPTQWNSKSKSLCMLGKGVEEENIILGNGSIELIYIITEILPSPSKP